MLKKLLFPAWICVSLIILTYSFTQVDLSLTFSKASLWQIIQRGLQHFGYFQRPLSTYVFVAIIILLTVLYGVSLRFISNTNIKRSQVWILIIVVGVILFLSYNAFSYDFFNYIFDAKIVAHYHQNPYQFKALDFPKDPMLSFMHSTHRVYPYGPSWLVLTIPLSFLGGNIFILTFYLFKSLMLLSFLGICYFIEKISEFTQKKDFTSLIFFALNPLILLETLVSGHNDVVMIFLSVAALYFVLKKKNLIGIFLLVLSIGIKYSTIILAPVFLYLIYKNIKKERINYNLVFFVTFLLMAFSVIATSLASGQNKNPEFQPWYLINMLPFAALLPKNKLILWIAGVTSIGALFSYVSFLFNGQWPTNIVDLKLWILATAIAVGFVCFGINKTFSAKR